MKRRCLASARAIRISDPQGLQSPSSGLVGEEVLRVCAPGRGLIGRVHDLGAVCEDTLAQVQTAETQDDSLPREARAAHSGDTVWCSTFGPSSITPSPRRVGATRADQVDERRRVGPVRYRSRVARLAIPVGNIIIPDPAALEVRRLLPGTRLCRNGTSGPLRRKSCPCTFVTSTILRSNAS